MWIDANLTTSKQDLDLISKEALILLHTDDQALQNGEGPQQEERTGQPHRGCRSQDPPPPPRPLLVLLQMCLSLLEKPHLRPQQP